MSTRVVTAVHDPRLALRLAGERALLYDDGPDAAADRPAHVRAASGLAWLGDRLAVVQDDANFVALVHPETRVVRPLTLPSAGGLRQFDTGRGNKADKLDLEACVAAQFGGRPGLVAFGSGSTPRRERLAFLIDRGAGLECTVVQHPRLYRALRDRPEFAGSELNIEGAVLAGGTLRLFQRGNGAPAEGLLPLNASADVSFEVVEAALAGAPDGDVSVGNVVQYALGELGGVALTFTDATEAPGGRVVFLATAEASPDTYRDGAVTGTVAGVIEGDVARYGWVLEPSGDRLARKAEAVVLHPEDARRAFVAFDPDDHARPATLAAGELVGPWW